MFIKSTQSVPQFVAGDATIIRELLHPKQDEPALNYSLAHATLEVGTTSTPHLLKTSSEVYYMLSGKGLVQVGETTQEVAAGDIVFIAAGERQFIKNIGSHPLEFLCIVSPPWQLEDEIILEA